MRRLTPWRIIKRVSCSPSISTIRLLRSSAVSRADEEKVEAVTNSPLVALKRSRHVPIIPEKVADGANGITIGIVFVLHIDAVEAERVLVDNTIIPSTPPSPVPPTNALLTVVTEPP
jgi:hypothetical protein